MKTVTFIVKDSETGSVQKFNAKLSCSQEGSKEVKGSLGGVMVEARLPIIHPDDERRNVGR